MWLSMNCRICSLGLLVAVGCLVMQARDVAANNIAATNVSMASGGDGYTYVQFDLSWDNSWKMYWSEAGSTVTNRDAAWVFVKYRQGVGTWEHATLATSGHTASDRACNYLSWADMGPPMLTGRL